MYAVEPEDYNDTFLSLKNNKITEVDVSKKSTMIHMQRHRQRRKLLRKMKIKNKNQITEKIAEAKQERLRKHHQYTHGRQVLKAVTDAARE